MQQIIIYRNTDGSCGVIIPAPETEMTIEEIAKKDVPAGLVWRIATSDKLPNDRTFRNAWTDDFDTETVDVNMPKARNIHMNNIRTARQIKFIEMGFPTRLDPDLEKAVIPEDTRIKLQKLRDIPQNLDLDKAITPEDLKAITPEDLM